MPVAGALAVIAHALSEVSDGLTIVAEAPEGIIDDALEHWIGAEEAKEFNELRKKGCAEVNRALGLLEGARSPFEKLASFFGGGTAAPLPDADKAFERRLLEYLDIKISDEYLERLFGEFGAADTFGDEQRDRAFSALRRLSDALCDPYSIVDRRTNAREYVRELAGACKDGAVLVADVAAPMLVPDITLTIAVTSIRSICSSGNSLMRRFEGWRKRLQADRDRRTAEHIQRLHSRTRNQARKFSLKSDRGDGPRE